MRPDRPNPLERLARRSLGRPLGRLDEHADAVEELAPAETQAVLPAAYEDASRERALAPNWNRPLDRLWDDADASRVEHRATRLLRFRDAALRGGLLWTRRRGYALASRTRGVGWWGRAERIDEPAALAGSPAGSRFFGHHLHDDLPARLVARSRAGLLVRPFPLPYRHAGLFERVVGPPVRELTGPTRFRELVVVDDLGQNRHKTRRYGEIRRGLAGHLGLPHAAESGEDTVFIRRGSDGAARTLVDEPELLARLGSLGVRVIDQERLTAEQLVRALWNATSVVGLEGSHLVPALYAAAPHAAFVTIQPPNRFAMVLKELCDGFGHAMGFVVGVPEGAGQRFRLADSDELLRVLDRTRGNRAEVRRLHESHHRPEAAAGAAAAVAARAADPEPLPVILPA